MTPEDAEEFTQSLGQSLAGNWRMIYWGQRMGVPKALQLTTREWVKERLGGYVNMEMAERRHAVAELQAEGASGPETAEVLGVDAETVYRDRRALDSANAERHEGDASANAEFLFEDEATKQVSRLGGFTGEVEWFTPREYLDAAIEVMGNIDLDPASSDLAQEHVGADAYYTRKTDGLKQPWRGRVFLNPPYGPITLLNGFVEKMVASYEAGDIEQGILLVNDAPDTGWYHRALRGCSALCFTRGRIPFLKAKDGQIEEKKAPPMGQTFFYFGPNIEKFCEVFSKRATKNGEDAPAGVFREGVA